VLETNRYLLENHYLKTVPGGQTEDVEIVPPVNIHPTAQISNSKIGPNTSIGAGCKIEKSEIENSIIEAGAIVNSSHLDGSLVGERAQISGISGALIVGDDSVLKRRT
jgi:glucose-1-phosphate thymidylyltransferase